MSLVFASTASAVRRNVVNTAGDHRSSGWRRARLMGPPKPSSTQQAFAWKNSRAISSLSPLGARESVIRNSS
eukprot:13105931-Alexandrium_andersonii.AAC.1